MNFPGAGLSPYAYSDVTWKVGGASRRMNPREIEDIVAREILGWTFVKDADVDDDHTSGPGWYKQEGGSVKFMGWPDQWATDMDATWKLAGQLSKQHHMSWGLNTWNNKSKVKLSYLPSGPSVEAEAGPDEMPLAMCLALLKMIEAKAHEKIRP